MLYCLQLHGKGRSIPLKTFAEIPYCRPDYKAVAEMLSSYTEKLKNAASYEEMRQVFFERQKAMREPATMASVCMIRADINTADPFYAEEKKFINREQPGLIAYEKAWNQALLDSPYRKDFSREFGDRVFVLLENQVRTKDPAISQDLVEESLLVDEYSRAVAGCSVEFMGKSCNFYGLLAFMEHPDRQVRKAAFQQWSRLYEGVADKLDDILGRMVKLRIRMANKMGFDGYIPFIYLRRGRFDYGAEQAAAFRKQVQEVITPAVAKLRQAQAQRLGIDKMHYYDENLYFPEGNSDPHGDKEFMVAAARKMYAELSPETREFFDYMVEHQLFDLETKPGKRLGGYCSRIPNERVPFIFSNFNGTSADTDVLTHEAGHAFQAYTAGKTIPIDSLCNSTSEINEIHSMSMETFTFPWMELFFGEGADKYRYAHLVDSLACMPYMCAVDEFQHRIYENPEMTGKDYRRVWHALEQKYLPWRDYDGNAFLEEGGFWMQKQHIFMYPFYYIDYALAQTCAFEFYTKMLENRDAAWNDYLKLCRSGGMRGYFDTLEYAGLCNPFVPGSVAQSVSGVLKVLESSGF